MIEAIYTIGGYGFTEEEYFKTLRQENIDILCDIRQRRGMRGAEYAFLNSRRLQKGLAKIDVRYVHFKDFAPTPAIRMLQKQEDESCRVKKRRRSGLTEAFVAAYRLGILEGRCINEFQDALPGTVCHPCLFCVEQDPAGCHRSIMAEWLASLLQVPVVHVRPESWKS